LGRGQKFAVLCLDLDYFKNVNDTLGHPFGDQILREVSARLRKCVREYDLVARVGGDEFAILQRDVTDPADTSHFVKGSLK
jgi:diguanylate cyclase (GGDEF)-like protein